MGGAAIGTVIFPGIGTFLGAKWGAEAGAIAGSGQYSYEQMRGAAFRELLNAGVDEATARAASSDEAVLSAMIEMGGTALDIFSLGTGKLITTLAKGGAKALGGEAAESVGKRLLKALGKYMLFDIGGEGLEEAVQETVSIANQNRDGTGTSDLAREAIETAWAAISGQNPDAAEQIWNAAKEGGKIAALFGGGMRMIDLAGQEVILNNAKKNPQDTTTSATVQSPTERDIIETTELWIQQINEAAGNQSEEVRMVDIDTTDESETWNENLSKKSNVSAFNEIHLAKNRDELLPNYQTAKIPDEKIAGYALNKEHPVGKFKAIGFEKALGYTVDNKDLLLLQVYRGLEKYRAVERTQTQYGRPFEVSMMVLGVNGRYAKVKTAWIIDNGAEEPRLVSIYVDE